MQAPCFFELVELSFGATFKVALDCGDCDRTIFCGHRCGVVEKVMCAERAVGVVATFEVQSRAVRRRSCIPVVGGVIDDDPSSVSCLSLTDDVDLCTWVETDGEIIEIPALFDGDGMTTETCDSDIVAVMDVVEDVSVGCDGVAGTSVPDDVALVVEDLIGDVDHEDRFSVDGEIDAEVRVVQ